MIISILGTPYVPAPMPGSGRRPKRWLLSTFRNGRPAARRRLRKNRSNRNPALHLFFTQGRRRGFGGGGHPGPQAPPARSRPGDPGAYERRGPPGSGDRRRSSTSCTPAEQSSCRLCCSRRKSFQMDDYLRNLVSAVYSIATLGSTIFVGRGDASDHTPRPRAGRAADLLGPFPHRAPVVAAEGRHRRGGKNAREDRSRSRRPFSREPSARRMRPHPSSTLSSTSTILPTRGWRRTWSRAASGKNSTDRVQE